MFFVFYSIPMIWIALTFWFLFHPDQSNQKISFISSFGSCLWWTIIQNFEFYIILLFLVTIYWFSNGLIAILFSFSFACPLSNIHFTPFLHFIGLQKDKNESKSKIARAFFIILSVIAMSLWLFVPQELLNNVLFNPTVYFLIPNILIINIITNIIGKCSFSDHPISMALNSLFIGLFPYTSFFF